MSIEKFNAKDRKVTITIRGKDHSNDLKIETVVRHQFDYQIETILRCNIKKYVLKLLDLAKETENSILTIASVEIEGINIIPKSINLYTDPKSILPVIDLLICTISDESIELKDAYIDKTSHINTYKRLLNM